MELKELKKGYIVRCGKRILRIEEITDDGIKTIAGIFSIKEVEPVEIGNNDSIIKVRIIYKAEVLGQNDPKPIREWPYYLEYFLKEKSVADIVLENDIKYVHDLQKWFRENELDIPLLPYL